MAKEEYETVEIRGNHTLQDAIRDLGILQVFNILSEDLGSSKPRPLTEKG